MGRGEKVKEEDEREGEEFKTECPCIAMTLPPHLQREASCVFVKGKVVTRSVNETNDPWQTLPKAVQKADHCLQANRNGGEISRGQC